MDTPKVYLCDFPFSELQGWLFPLDSWTTYFLNTFIQYTVCYGVSLKQLNVSQHWYMYVKKKLVLFNSLGTILFSSFPNSSGKLYLTAPCNQSAGSLAHYSAVPQESITEKRTWILVTVCLEVLHLTIADSTINHPGTFTMSHKKNLGPTRNKSKCRTCL